MCHKAARTELAEDGVLQIHRNTDNITVIAGHMAGIHLAVRTFVHGDSLCRILRNPWWAGLVGLLLLGSMLLLGHGCIPHCNVIMVTTIDGIGISAIGALLSCLTRVMLCIKLLGL